MVVARVGVSLAIVAALSGATPPLPSQSPVAEIIRWRGDSAGLSRIGSVRLSAGMHVAVTLPQDGKVLLLERRTGARVAMAGRRGEGPGEVRTIANHAVHGDTLVVLDRSLMRTSRFHIDGTLISTEPVPTSLRVEGTAAAGLGGLQQPRPVGARAGGTLIYQAFAPTGDQRIETRGLRARLILVEVERSGHVRSVIGELPDDGCVLRDAGVEVRSPFCWPALHSVSGSSEWIAIGSATPGPALAEYTVHLWHAATGARTTLRGTVPVASQPSAERDSILDDLRDRLPPAARIIERTSPPKGRPPLQLVVVGITGHVLVGLRDPSGGAPRWLLHDPSGAVRATFVLPPDFTPHDLSGFTIAGVQRRPDGHEDIVMFRVGQH